MAVQPAATLLTNPFGRDPAIHLTEDVFAACVLTRLSLTDLFAGAACVSKGWNAAVKEYEGKLLVNAAIIDSNALDPNHVTAAYGWILVTKFALAYGCPDLTRARYLDAECALAHATTNAKKLIPSIKAHVLQSIRVLAERIPAYGSRRVHGNVLAGRMRAQSPSSDQGNENPQPPTAPVKQRPPPVFGPHSRPKSLEFGHASDDEVDRNLTVMEVFV